MLSAEVAWWRAAMSLGRYALLRSGPAAHHGIQVLGFADSRPGLAAPDIQYHLLLLMYDNHGRSIDGADGFMPYFNLSRPQSRGRVFIRSADPTAAPAIQPNYLQEGEDVRVIREGLKIARDIIARRALDTYRSHEFAPGADIASDAEIDGYIRRTAESVYHPVGTCKWAPISSVSSTTACGSEASIACASSMPQSCPPSAAATPTPPPS